MCLTFFIIATIFSVMCHRQMVTPVGTCVGSDCFKIMSVLSIYGVGYIVWGFALRNGCYRFQHTFSPLGRSAILSLILMFFVQEHYATKS